MREGLVSACAWLSAKALPGELASACAWLSAKASREELVLAYEWLLAKASRAGWGLVLSEEWALGLALS